MNSGETERTHQAAIFDSFAWPVSSLTSSTLLFRRYAGFREDEHDDLLARRRAQVAFGKPERNQPFP